MLIHQYSLFTWPEYQPKFTLENSLKGIRNNP
jgi:hypothetical protein